ncbi:MAG: prepilin-type N-terminal cleavage/methylation domain-containing protein [Fidelibacterota bacterium]
MTDNRNNNGFTLVEMIIWIVLIAIIGGVTAMVVATQFKAVSAVEGRKAIVIDGSSSTRKFTRDFAHLPDNQSLTLAKSDQIEFFTNQGFTVQYKLGNGLLSRQIIGQGGLQILSKNVDIQTSAFNYYDKQNNLLTGFPLSANNRKKVWRVELVLTLVNGDEIILNKADVFPENLKINSLQ